MNTVPNKKVLVLTLTLIWVLSVPLLVKSPRTASAQGSGTQKIAFVSYRDGNWEIYVINADGSNLTNLTNHAAADYHPDWSPDGTQLAFSSNRNGEVELYIMDVSTAIVRRLTDVQGARECDWSPDGTRIVFVHDSKIFVINADGTNQQQLTYTGISENPARSPDSTRIAFGHRTGANDDMEIYVMNADGSNQYQLTNNGNPGEYVEDFQPAWSPNGMRIAFTSNRSSSNHNIYIMNADGSNQIQLTNQPSSDFLPAWSSDGSKLAFTTDRTGGGDIYSMNADGTKVTRLTTDPEGDYGPAWQPTPPTGCSIEAPAEVYQGDTFTLTLACADISDSVFGFQVEHEITAGAGFVTAQASNYTAGTIFQGQSTLAGPNGVDIYALSLQAGGTEATGDFTLGSVDYSAVAPGQATFDLINLILGDINGEAITGVQTSPSATTVTIDDLILSLSGSADPQGYAHADTLTLELEGNPVYTNLSKTFVPADGTTDFSYTNIKGHFDWLQVDGPSHVTCREVLTFPTDAGNEILPSDLILRAGDVNDDDAVNLTDATALGQQYGQPASGELDINHDGIVNILDLIHVGRNYNTTGPTDCTG